MLGSRNGTHETLADIVLQRFRIDPGPLEAARRSAAESGRRLELVLADEGLVSEAQMALAVAEYLELPPVSLAHFRPDRDLFAFFPPQAIARLPAFPLARWGNQLALATHDPFDLTTIDEVRSMTGLDVVLFVARQTEIDALRDQYGMKADQVLADVLRDMDTPESAIDLSAEDEGEPSDAEMLDLAEQAPVVRVVNAILIQALQRRASDIHIEPMENVMHVRYRIDGILYDVPAPPHYMQLAIISRLKIISRIDIAERRLPQDGRFAIRALDRDVDVRVSMIPSVHGQKAVLRILDKANLKPDMSSLGLDKRNYDQMMRALHQPSGLILVTGPTGSGKTTTLYSALQELNDQSVNIVTVEDPVEYQLPRIIQIQTHTEIGLTFAGGLRAILRQDPDIILVGEIRDAETAKIAIQASLTGHLVLSTLHTNDAAGAVARLLHMGVEPFLIVSSLLMAQAQRLYRKLCPHCKEEKAIAEEIMSLHKLDVSVFDDARIYGPCGCVHCGGIGYRGRDAIMEILEMDEDIRELVLQESNATAIRKDAAGKGMVTLRAAGLERVAGGDTSIEEALRVTTYH